MSDAAAADPAVPETPSGASAAEAEVIHIPTQGGTSTFVCVIEPAFVFNATIGRVYDVPVDTVAAIEEFMTPDGFSRKGAVKTRFDSLSATTSSQPGSKRPKATLVNSFARPAPRAAT